MAALQHVIFFISIFSSAVSLYYFVLLALGIIDTQHHVHSHSSVRLFSVLIPAQISSLSIVSSVTAFKAMTIPYNFRKIVIEGFERARDAQLTKQTEQLSWSFLVG